MEFATDYNGIADCLTATYHDLYPLWDSDVVVIDPDAKRVYVTCDGLVTGCLVERTVASLDPYIASVLKQLGFFEDN